MLGSILGVSGTQRRYGVSFSARALTTVSAFAIATVIASPHAARAAATAPASQEAEGNLDEVIVTGSRIIREGYEAPTPLSVVDAAAIERAPAANIAEFVNTMPVFSGSQTPNNTQNGISAGTAGANTLNLRGIGAARTLVLLDGQRSVGSLLAGSVDINAFPQQLISRVEVVTGGASAVYGSDAVSGVANFVLDRSYTGVKGELSGGLTSYGDDKNAKVALAAGFDFGGGRGHALLSGENVYQKGIILGANGRPWDDTLTVNMVNPLYGTNAALGQSTSVPQRLILPNAGFSNATPGGMIVSGPLKGVVFGQGGATHLMNYGSIIANPFMVGGSVQETLIPRDQIGSLAPGQKRSGIFIRADYDITDSLNLFVQTSWNGSRTFSQCCPQFQPGNAAVIKADNAFIPATLRAQMVALGVTSFQTGSMNADIGPFGSNNERNVVRNVVGGTGKFDAFNTGWSWDAYFQNGYSRSSVNITNVGSRSKYTQATDAIFAPANFAGIPVGTIICRSTLTNPKDSCIPYNAMGIGVNDLNAVKYVRADIGSYQYANIMQNVWVASVTGEPISLWAGPVSLALSAEHRTERVKNITDEQSKLINWFGGNYLPINGSFNVTEGAAETVIPLAKGESWAVNWDVNAAARFTHYSTSGNVVTWKVGSTYTPIPDVKFRVTQSRDIRAPNLQELFAAGTSSQGEIFDPFTSTTPTVRGFATGNLNLKPEKADTTGVGIVLQPSFLPGFSASVDYWKIGIKSAIRGVGTADVVRLCFEGNQQFCPNITRVNGLITVVQTSPFNIAVQKTDGLDIEGSYRFALDDVIGGMAGNFSLHGNASLYFKNFINDGITVPTDTAGENQGGAPPNMRYSVTIGYDIDPVNVSLTGRAVSSGNYNNSYIECTSGCPVSSTIHTTINNNQIPGGFWLDAAISYKLAITDSVAGEMFLNVRNLGNVDPPKIYNVYYLQNTNQSTYDAMGRVFRAGIRFKM